MASFHGHHGLTTSYLVRTSEESPYVNHIHRTYDAAPFAPGLTSRTRNALERSE